MATNEEPAVERQHPLDRWLAHVWPDIALTTGLTILHYFLHRWGTIDWWIGEVSVEQRRFIYVGLATVAALVAGSNNTAVGSYVSSSGDVMKQMRIKHGASMRKSLRSNGLWLWAVAVVSIICIALDPLSPDPKKSAITHGAAWLAEGALLLIVTKYFRLVMLQDVLLKANDLSRQQEVLDDQKKDLRPIKKKKTPAAPSAAPPASKQSAQKTGPAKKAAPAKKTTPPKSTP
jgi:hypothetical protein